ncbi:MAG TPA: hypothetical protein VJB59_13845 [Bdellovibrionota bacterium]|nr:hypothetical protein [Bdellovibrionota bacterium]
MPCDGRCPGCSHRGWDRLRSEKQKFDWVSAQFVSCFEGAIEALRTVRTESERWGYRQKVCLRAAWDGSSWAFGFRLRSELPGKFEFLPIRGCPVHCERINRSVELLERVLPLPELLPLVFLVLSGTLLTFVVKSRNLAQPARAALLAATGDLARLGITGVYVNLNPSAGNRVFSSHGWEKLWGEDRGVAEVRSGKLSEPLRVSYGPSSFQQLLGELYADALNEIRDFFLPGQQDSIVDAYSGVGTSMLLWRAARARFLGIELSGEAVRCAEINLGAGACLQGRVSDRLPQIDQWLAGRDFKLFVNPPRGGLEREVLAWTVARRPAKVAYLSCNARTQTRDLSLLTGEGYAIRRIIPYDFFPQTHHVESLVLLERRVLNSDSDERSASRTRALSGADG